MRSNWKKKNTEQHKVTFFMYGVKLETADVRMGFYDYSFGELHMKCNAIAWIFVWLFNYFASMDMNTIAMQYWCWARAVFVSSARRICANRARYLYCARISVSNIDISQNSNESSNNFFILMVKHFGSIGSVSVYFPSPNLIWLLCLLWNIIL